LCPIKQQPEQFLTPFCVSFVIRFFTAYDDHHSSLLHIALDGEIMLNSFNQAVFCLEKLPLLLSLAPVK